MRTTTRPLTATQRGSALALALCGAWRDSPPAIKLSESTLAEILPVLTGDGAGGLAWLRLRGSEAASSRLARQARESYRAGVLEVARWEEHIRRIVALLRAGGVEPVLIKGWASARPYAEPALRPATDIDLCVRPDEMPAAQAIVRCSGLPAVIDLHAGIPDLPDRQWDEVIQHSWLVPLGDADVRILGPEDHLRLLCFHFVRHSGCRPIWLCDVAAAVEALPAAFDWDYLLAGNQRLSDWVRCVVGLAGRLLDARPPQPARAWAQQVPPWLERTVLWRWGAGLLPRSLGHYLHHPIEGIEGLRYHGFNPIRGVFQLGLSPYTRWPVPLLQVGGGMVVALLRKWASWRGRCAEADVVGVHRPLALVALARYAVGQERP
jgi:hypothetical protein